MICSKCKRDVLGGDGHDGCRVEPRYGDDSRKPPRSVWAVFDRDGVLQFIDTAQGENEVWAIWLGWPAAEEIAEAKQRGFRVAPVDVIERKPM